MDPMARNKDLNNTLAKVATGMKDVAVRGFNLDQAYRIYYTSITRTPKLRLCTNESLARCLVDAASLGLFIGGTLGQCYAVPFKNKNLKGPLDHEAVFMIGYQGQIELMRRSGEIESITAELVYENDHFIHVKGLTEILDHIPFGYREGDRGKSGSRGKVTHGYCIVRFKGGGHHIETMSVEEIEARRRRSRAKDDGPWVTDWPAMARKTLVRASWPWVPKTPDIIRAMALDEEVENPDAAMELPAQPLAIDMETGEVKEESAQAETDKLVEELMRDGDKVEAPKPQAATPTPPPASSPRRTEKAKAKRSPKPEVQVAPEPDLAPEASRALLGDTQEMFPTSPEDVEVDLTSAQDAVDKLLSTLERGHQNVLIHTFCRKHGIRGWVECKSVQQLEDFYEEIDAFKSSLPERGA
jgi:recombination protein RecT